MVNGVRVKLLTIFDHLVLNIAIAILLDLCGNPTDGVSYNNLYLHTDKIKANSKGVGGSFSIKVTNH